MSSKLKVKKKTRFPVQTSNQAAQAFGRAMQNCQSQLKDMEQKAYEDGFTVGEDWSNTINTVTTMMALRRLYGFSTKRLLDVIRTANKYVEMANEGEMSVLSMMQDIDESTACERCMNVLAYKYLNGADGYEEYSDEWKKCNTECDFCKNKENTKC